MPVPIFIFIFQVQLLQKPNNDLVNPLLPKALVSIEINHFLYN